MTYPAAMGNIKVELISKGLLRKGFKVTWAQMDQPQKSWEQDGFTFANVGGTGGLEGHDFFNILKRILKLLAFCRKSKGDCIYLDDWMFLRENPGLRLIFHVLLRTIGIKTIFDQRDPYIDFNIAVGKIKEGSWEQRRLTIIYRLISRFTDLSIFPSKVYEEDMRSRGLSSKSSLGIFRGVDTSLFKDTGQGSEIREKLGIQEKFVVGWFGMMHGNRRIEEVIVPLIEGAATYIPNIHFLIGGKGELETKFIELESREPDLPMHNLGFVPYRQLPGCIAACDVLLCPLKTDDRFSRHASPLKILEALAIGRPVIATETEVSKKDFSGLRGVIWTGMEYDEFLKSLIAAHDGYEHFLEEARGQALNFQEFSSDAAINRIVCRIEDVLGH
jgi:glycosyltransferase involved in cell wall biosynthesis